MVPPTKVMIGEINKQKTAVSKTELDPRTTLPRVVDSQKIAGLGFFEREGDFLKEKRGLMGFFRTEEKLSSPFFDTAPKDSLKVRVGTIIIPGFSGKEPTVESVTMVNAPTSALKDMFQREKPTSKFFQGIKKVGRVLYEL